MKKSHKNDDGLKFLTLVTDSVTVDRQKKNEIAPVLCI